MSFILILTGSSPLPEPVPDGVYLPVHDCTLILELSEAPALAETQIWLNASSYLVNKVGSLEHQITVRRGRDDETQPFRAGRLSLSLDNTERDFDTRNGASPFAGALKARRQVRLRVHAGKPGSGATVFPLFRGFVHGWPRNYGLTNQFSWIPLEASDGFRILAQSDLTEGTFTLDDDVLGLLDSARLGGASAGDELSGAIVHALLDMAAWPENLRDIDAGVVLVDGALEAPGLSALHKIAEAEHGAVLIDAAGRVVFLDRMAEWSNPRLSEVQATFGHAVGALPIADVSGIGEVDALISNDVRRTGLSGIEYSDEDAVSIEEHGRSKSEETVAAVLDVDVEALVQVELARFAWPSERITQLVIDPTIQPATLYPQVWGRELLDRVAVALHPPGGAADPVADSLIQGLVHRITGSTWQTSWSLAPAATESILTLDDDIAGVLDDDDYVLAP